MVLAYLDKSQWNVAYRHAEILIDNLGYESDSKNTQIRNEKYTIELILRE
jgi:hypothetical protein